MAFVQSSPFKGGAAGFATININCRQAAQNQDIQMAGVVNQMGLWDGQLGQAAINANNRPWSVQVPQPQGQGPQISDLHRTTAFTNGRKRSRENIQCDEMKKVKTDRDNDVQAAKNVLKRMTAAPPPPPPGSGIVPAVLAYQGTAATYGIDQLHDVHSRNRAACCCWLTEFI